MDDFSLDYGTLENEYTGLKDTTESFSGDNSFQDVELGSQIPLYLQRPSDAVDNTLTSVPDFMNLDPNDPSSLWDSLSLSGVSDPPFGSARQSTPFPGVSDPAGSTFNALSALSKFGSSFATLFGSHPQTMRPAAYPTASVTTGQKPLSGITGSNTVLIVIVAAALILLLARTKE